MGVVKNTGRAAVVAIASWALAACSNTSAPNGALPSGASASVAAAPRYVVAGSAVTLSSLRLANYSIGLGGLDLGPTIDATSKQVLYASLFEGEIFSAYRLPHKKPFCQSQLVKLTIVNSIGTDKDGNLWLPTAIVGAKQSKIYSFAPDCGAPGTTLSIPHNADPHGIAFGPDGTKYGLMTYSGPTTSVSVYPPGATSPAAELTDARLNNRPEPADAVGVDSAGHVYVTCCADLKVSPFAIEFSGQGSQQRGKKIVLQQITAPGGSITFDRSNNMIVPDGGGASLNIYAPPYTGTPAIYPLKGTPWQCDLSHKQGKIACSNIFNANGSAIDLYAYPSMTYLYSLKSQGYPSISLGGVAFFP